MSPIEEVIINKKSYINPIWIMRQAGRYLPEFREIRKQNPDFVKLCLNKKLSSEITLQPLKRFDLDAAIIFSDILMLPYGLNQNVVFKKNMGPLLNELNLEKISSVEPVLGYMHRGYEKLAEVRTYPQITTLVNRIDWVSGFANEIPFIAATEKLMEIEAPERAKHIRLILTEMARIASHFVFNGAYALEIGALTPIFLAMEDRERILDLIESVTGGRFHPNFNRIGGIKPAAGSGPTTKKNIQDLPAGFYQDTRDAMEKVLEAVERMENLVGGNEVFKVRTKGVGIISKELAEEYGVSGPILRASGVKLT